MGYELPDTRGGRVFKELIAPYHGKLLLVDFWGINCGPCRAGIERTAHLRDKYRDSKQFKFIYLTSEKDSPLKAYTAYVDKYLPLETSYRISDDDYIYLRALFAFNGIPRYVLFSPSGRFFNTNFESYQLASYLNSNTIE